MQTPILAIVILSAIAVPMNDDALMDRSFTQVLQDNCIKSKYKILADNENYTVVECDGHWTPWQSTATKYDVRKQLGKIGITPKPVANRGQNAIWKSGFDEFDQLPNGKKSLGKKSLFKSKIQGLTAAKKTYLILFKN